MNRYALFLLAAIILAAPASADLIVYGVEDIGVNDTQLFQLNITTGWYEEIGPQHDGTDVEAISWMGLQIVGYTGNSADQQEFVDLDFTTEALSVINDSSYTGPDDPEIRGMATDGNGTLWGFIAGDGYCTINALGDCTLLFPSSESIEGLAVNSAGTFLYGIRKNGKLFEVTVATGNIVQIAIVRNLKIENLEMASDTEVAFFWDDGPDFAYYVYDLVTEQLSSTILSGVTLTDVEGFVYSDPWVLLERTTWGSLKAQFE